MKFNVNSNELKEALESLQVKGKHLTNNGFSSSNFGSIFYAHIYENTLSLYNGDSTFMLKITLQVEEGENGSFVADSSLILPYLKSFGDTVNVVVGDYISMSSGTKKANVPKLIEHPSNDALQRLIQMTNHVRYEPNPQTMFAFGNSNFEGAFTLSQNVFKDCIKNAELVKSGIYNLNFHEGVVKITSTTNATTSYEESITPTFLTGDSATLDFSSPLYSFFEKDQMLNFYVKDEFPMLIVANDRLVLKAPYVGGN